MNNTGISGEVDSFEDLWAAVRLLAGYLAAPTSGQDLDSAFAALAILESVSEAAVTIPCGLLAVLWWYPAIRKGRRKQDAA